MDPQAALDAAESAINDGDKAEAREYLANYASWRRNGGFQPAGGDARHASLLKRLRSRKRVSKNSRKAQGPRKRPPSIRYSVRQIGVGTVESALLKSEALGLYKHLRRTTPEGTFVVTAYAVPTHHSGKRLVYAARRGKERDVTNLFEKQHGAMTSNRKRVSKNSRKARLRHNVEERASSPNLIMWGAILVGGFLAWRWLSERNKTAPASLVTSPGKSGTIGTDAGWAAYQQRPMAPRDTFALNRAQHDEFWGTLTDTEKQKALQLYAMPESQIMAAAQDPANASVVGKGMAFTLRVMAQQQAPQGGRTPPNSTQVPPETGTKGIGNYFNDGD